MDSTKLYGVHDDGGGDLLIKIGRPGELIKWPEYTEILRKPAILINEPTPVWERSYGCAEERSMVSGHESLNIVWIAWRVSDIISRVWENPGSAVRLTVSKMSERVMKGKTRIT